MKLVKIIVLLLIFASCSDKPTPKAKGFFRIKFPAKSYKLATEQDKYTFEIPIYATLKDDDSAKYVWQEVFVKSLQEGDTIKSLEKNNVENYSWQSINFPKQNAQLYLSYFAVKNNLAEYLEDTHKFVYKHVIKADGINMKEYAAPQRNVYGVLYDIEGNTASSVQFYLTDSTQHFLRGSLYLNEKPNKDSLNVVIDFLREDVIRIMQTLEWK